MTDGRFTIGLVASEEMSALRRDDRCDCRVGADPAPRRHDPDRRGSAAGHELRRVRRLLRALRPADGRRPELLRRRTMPPRRRSRVVLSQRAWRTTFGGDPLVVGTDDPVRRRQRARRRRRADAFAIPREADLWFAQHNSESIGHMFDAYVRFKPGLTPAAIAGSAAADVGRPREEVSRPGQEPHLRDASAARHDGRRSRPDRPHRLCGDRAAAAAGDGQRCQPDAGARHDARARDRRAHGARRDAVGHRAARCWPSRCSSRSRRRPSACRSRPRRFARSS